MSNGCVTIVTSLGTRLGPEGNLLDPTPASCRQVALPHPILSNSDLAKLLYVNEDGSTPGYRAFAIDGLPGVMGFVFVCALIGSWLCRGLAGKTE